MSFPLEALLPEAEGVQLWTLPDQTAVGRYLRTDLSSVFQPIVASRSGRIGGHEAFVRAHGRGERDMTPWSIFSLVANDTALVALDRLCRCVHVLNFLAAGEVSGKLFLNVHGRLLAAVREDHGHTFRNALEKLGLDSLRVVIETPEAANLDRKLLALVLANYRLNGFRVAASTLGIPDLEAVLRVVRPDYVKVHSTHLQRESDMLRAIAIARDGGVRPVFTRVELPWQRDLLAEQEEVLFQGWAVGRAVPRPTNLIQGESTP